MSLKKLAVVGMVVAAMTRTGCDAMTTIVKDVTQ